MSEHSTTDLSFERRVAPIFFAGAGSRQSHPTLTVVTGQPGAGKSAALGAMSRPIDARPATVSADGLAALHPDFLESRRWRPLEAQSALAPLVAEWLSKALDHARETRTSLDIEGSFSNPSAVFGTADSFAEYGFATNVVVVAARRHESLLTAASRFFDLRRRGRPALFTDRESHNRGWVGAQSLVRDAEAQTPTDRLTIIDRRGETLFNASRDDGFAGATAALTSVESKPITTLQAAEWFSELRRITEYARSTRELAPPVADVLVELHELALTDVLPSMNVRSSSSFFTEQQLRLGRELVSLRQDATPAAAPSIQPPAPVLEPVPPSTSHGLSL